MGTSKSPIQRRRCRQDNSQDSDTKNIQKDFTPHSYGTRRQASQNATASPNLKYSSALAMIKQYLLALAAEVKPGITANIEVFDVLKEEKSQNILKVWIQKIVLEDRH